MIELMMNICWAYLFFYYLDVANDLLFKKR
jgi:hypothetical protein